MRCISITILCSVIVTSFCWKAADARRQGADWLWLTSEVAAPGRMALDEIHSDFQTGRSEMAMLKLEALRKQWATFEHEGKLRGPALGQVMEIFGEIDRTKVGPKPVQTGR